MSLTLSLHLQCLEINSIVSVLSQKNVHSLSTPPTEAVGRVGGGVSPTAGGQGA